MKPISILFTLFWAVLVFGSAHKSLEAVARHARLSRQTSSEMLVPRAVKRASCSAKSSKKATSSTKKASSTHTASSSKQTQEEKVQAGVINIKSNGCGEVGAVRVPSQHAGPNGQEAFLNCGIESSHGWNPPHITVDNVITKSLSSAVQDPDSPFKACSKYIGIFNKYAGEYGVPAILIASIAMQESSCNPNTVGGAGEQGLMQLTKDKCGSAPHGNCKDPDYNIHTGTKFFKGLLDANGGNVAVALGKYNGWYVGLTKAKATAARWGPCCRCQNNLDYIHQTLNGWAQNINAYEANMGIYHNLDHCHS